MTLSRFQKLVVRLNKLLSDPQEGMISWHMDVGNTMEELFKEWGECRSNHLERQILKVEASK